MHSPGLPRSHFTADRMSGREKDKPQRAHADREEERMIDTNFDRRWWFRCSAEQRQYDDDFGSGRGFLGWFIATSSPRIFW